jgi:type IV pilus assembly protein PilV
MKTLAHLPARRPSRQRGVSMIELLVSLLIFTFGMLGLAGLQTRTLVFNQASLMRTQATALTDDILDRMRADRINALAGRWDSTLETGASSITGTALYQTDLKDWKQQVENLLPAGSKASISTVTTAGAADFGTVTVVIQWDDSRGAEALTKLETKTRL